VKNNAATRGKSDTKKIIKTGCAFTKHHCCLLVLDVLTFLSQDFAATINRELWRSCSYLHFFLASFV
jgi:hypothetical protein